MALATTPASNVAAYSIAGIEYELGPLDKVGKLKAGFLCLPKGALRWRDVARNADGVTVARLSAALREAGVATAQPPDALYADPVPATPFRIKIIVERLSMKLCVAGSGLVKQSPMGSGTLHVRWETYDRERRVLVDTQRFGVPVELNGRDVRGTSTVLQDALGESAVRYAGSRR